MTAKKRYTSLWLFLVLLPMLAACSTTPNFIASRINPLPKRTVESVVLNDVIPNPVPVGEKTTIISAHSDPDGIRDVQIFVNDQLVDIQNPPFSQTFFKSEYDFIPKKPGDYTLKIKAFSVNPNVNPAETVLRLKAVENLVAVSTRPLPPAPNPTPTSSLIACANNAVLVSDVTVPDGTKVQPGEKFVKTWRIKNTGTCDWGAGYTFSFVNGADLGASRIDVPPTRALDTVDISLNMEAPAAPGTYRSVWQLFAPDGSPFGEQCLAEIVVPQTCKNPEISLFTAQPSAITAGQSATLQWQVSGAKEITITPNVGQPGQSGSTLTVSPPETTQYTLTARDGDCVSTAQVTVTVAQPVTLIDFIAAANTAIWQTDDGTPVAFGRDPRAETPPDPSLAYVLWRDNVTLQNGTTAARVLEIHPATAAFVQGRYIFNLAGGVQPTDKIQLQMTFLNGTTASNGATYSVAFQPVGQSPIQLGAVALNPDGVIAARTFPLTDVPAGAQGEFILQANYGAEVNDSAAVWVVAALVRP